MIETVRAENLSCQRGARIVLSGVSFNLTAGAALMLRGPNGAGKTTLLRTLAGYLSEAGGALRFEGAGEASVPLGEHQEHLHFIGHLNAVKTRLTVLENILFWQSFYGAADAGIAAAERALDAFALLDLADVPAAHLSAGQTRRLALARLVAVARPLWLLDEPSASLDAASTSRLESAVAAHLNGGGLAIIATHIDLALTTATTLTLSPGGYDSAEAA
jgi:heme exporter protein A